MNSQGLLVSFLADPLGPETAVVPMLCPSLQVAAPSQAAEVPVLDAKTVQQFCGQWTKVRCCGDVAAISLVPTAAAAALHGPTECDNAVQCRAPLCRSAALNTQGASCMYTVSMS